jgi:translation initiation factor 1
MRDENPTVYSTEWGRICPKCGRPEAKCICGNKKDRGHADTAAKTNLPPRDGVVRVFRDSKGRKGKTVTLIHGVPGGEDALKTLLSDLKRKVGSGGAVKDGIIEIQGDHRDTLVEELKTRGFTVKKAGG